MVDLTGMKRYFALTKRAAIWAITLSALSLVVSIVEFLSGSFSSNGGYSVLSTALLSVNLVPFIYLILFLIFQQSNPEIASISFLRGGSYFVACIISLLFAFSGLYSIANFIQPVLSVAIIIYAFSCKKVTIADFANSTPSKSKKEFKPSPWYHFFIPPVATVVLVFGLAALIALSQGGLNSNSFGGALLLLSGLGIVANIIGAVIASSKGKGSISAGCVLTIFLLLFIGFYGCSMALSGAAL